jgi:hypothetical protein
MHEAKTPPPEYTHCNECRSTTLHHNVGRVRHSGRDEESGIHWWKEFEMLQCGGCQEVVLRRRLGSSEDEGVEVKYFPPPASRHPPSWRYKLPPEFRLLLEEIYRSLDAENLSLPMMGTRTLIDLLIIKKVGDVGTFREKLNALEKCRASQLTEQKSFGCCARCWKCSCSSWACTK